MPVEIVSHGKSRLRTSELQLRVESLLTHVRRGSWAMCLLLTTDDEIRRLNRRFRGKNRATDVLSFPSIAAPRAPRRGTPARYLGDLAVSLETASRQAKALRHSLLCEATILCAHGILHLCDYDHERGEVEARRMLRRERALLRAIGIDRDPLTGRSPH